MKVTTVGDVRKALENYDDDMPCVIYDMERYYLRNVEPSSSNVFHTGSLIEDESIMYIEDLKHLGNLIPDLNLDITNFEVRKIVTL